MVDAAHCPQRLAGLSDHTTRVGGPERHKGQTHVVI